MTLISGATRRLNAIENLALFRRPDLVFTASVYNPVGPLRVPNASDNR
jgi:hypothetical protein